MFGLGEQMSGRSWVCQELDFIDWAQIVSRCRPRFFCGPRPEEMQAILAGSRAAVALMPVL